MQFVPTPKEAQDLISEKLSPTCGLETIVDVNGEMIERYTIAPYQSCPNLNEPPELVLPLDAMLGMVDAFVDQDNQKFVDNVEKVIKYEKTTSVDLGETQKMSRIRECERNVEYALFDKFPLSIHCENQKKQLVFINPGRGTLSRYSERGAPSMVEVMFTRRLPATWIADVKMLATSLGYKVRKKWRTSDDDFYYVGFNGSLLQKIRRSGIGFEPNPISIGSALTVNSIQKVSARSSFSYVGYQIKYRRKEVEREMNYTTLPSRQVHVYATDAVREWLSDSSMFRIKNGCIHDLYSTLTIKMPIPMGLSTVYPVDVFYSKANVQVRVVKGVRKLFIDGKYHCNMIGRSWYNQGIPPTFKLGFSSVDHASARHMLSGFSSIIIDLGEPVVGGGSTLLDGYREDRKGSYLIGEKVCSKKTFCVPTCLIDYTSAEPFDDALYMNICGTQFKYQYSDPMEKVMEEISIGGYEGFD